MKRILILAYGFVCYLVFLGLFGAFILFVGGIGGAWSIDRGAPVPLAEALSIDLGLLLLFGLQHSVMARRGFKRWWTRIVPPSIERSTYVLASSVVIGLIVWQWRPIPIDVWHVEQPVGAIALWALFGAGWGIGLISTFLIHHGELFGLQQVWARWHSTPHAAPRFQTPLFYRVVRHPMQAGMALGLWATPHMTLDHLVLAAGLTAYILVGLYFEERDLVRTFGARYEAYRGCVPKLVPRLRNPHAAPRASNRARATQPADQ